MTAQKQEQSKKKTTLRLNPKRGPVRLDYALFGIGMVVCFLLFNHPDIQETARHAYILIQSTLDGDFLNFFENTFSRVYGYPYVNAAHYNILMYILYAIWELPLYLIERIGGFAFSDLMLSLWCKVIGVSFYLGCGFLVQRIAQQLHCRKTACRWAPLMFWLNPISFFTTVVMGQYDSICLFFTLWALVLFFEKKYWKFVLMAGVGIVFKFFPLFLMIPLLLLVEKRPLRLLGYGAASLWLYLPTTLLFIGRTGDAAFFNQLMSQRLFASVFSGGMMDASRFGLVMILICVAAYLYHPADDWALRDAALYGSMVVLSCLFLLVLWHPQWVILLVPFLLLVGMRQRDRAAFAYLNGAFCIGFFLLTAMVFPKGLEGNLLDLGALSPVIGPLYGLAELPRSNAFYFELLPYFKELAPLLFYGPLFCYMLFAFPLRNGSLADRLNGGHSEKFSNRLACWGIFAVAFVGFWLLPSLFSYLKTVGVL